MSSIDKKEERPRVRRTRWNKDDRTEDLHGGPQKTDELPELNEEEYDEQWEHEWEDIDELENRHARQNQKPFFNRGRGRGQVQNRHGQGAYNKYNYKGRHDYEHHAPRSQKETVYDTEEDDHLDLPPGVEMTNLKVKIQDGKRFAEPEEGADVVFRDQERSQSSRGRYIRGRFSGGYHHSGARVSRGAWNTRETNPRYSKEEEVVDCREVLNRRKRLHSDTVECDLREKLQKRETESGDLRDILDSRDSSAVDLHGIIVPPPDLTLIDEYQAGNTPDYAEQDVLERSRSPSPVHDMYEDSRGYKNRHQDGDIRAARFDRKSPESDRRSEEKWQRRFSEERVPRRPDMMQLEDQENLQSFDHGSGFRRDSEQDDRRSPEPQVERPWHSFSPEQWKDGRESPRWSQDNKWNTNKSHEQDFVDIQSRSRSQDENSERCSSREANRARTQDEQWERDGSRDGGTHDREDELIRARAAKFGRETFHYPRFFRVRPPKGKIERGRVINADIERDIAPRQWSRERSRSLRSHSSDSKQARSLRGREQVSPSEGLPPWDDDRNFQLERGRSPSRERIRSPSRDLVRSPSRDHVRSPPREHIRSPSKDCVRNSIRGRARSPPRGLLRSPPRGLLRSPPRGLLRSPPRGLLRSPPRGLLRSPQRVLLRSPPKGLLRSPPRELLRSSPRELLRSPPRPLMRSPPRALIRSPARIRSPLRERIKSPPRERMRSPPRQRMRSPLRGRIRSPVERERSPAGERSRSPRERVRSPPRERVRSPPREKVKSPPRERGRSPPRERGRSPPRERGRSPPRERVRTPPRDRIRSPPRERGRSPIRERVRSPPRERERSPPRERIRSPLRERLRSPPRERARSPQKERVRSPPRGRARTPPRERMRSPPREQQDQMISSIIERNKIGEQERRSREQEKGRTQNQPRNPSKDVTRNKGRENVRDKSPERNRRRSQDRNRDTVQQTAFAREVTQVSERDKIRKRNNEESAVKDRSRERVRSPNHPNTREKFSNQNHSPFFKKEDHNQRFSRGNQKDKFNKKDDLKADHVSNEDRGAHSDQNISQEWEKIRDFQERRNCQPVGLPFLEESRKKFESTRDERTKDRGSREPKLPFLDDKNSPPTSHDPGRSWLSHNSRHLEHSHPPWNSPPKRERDRRTQGGPRDENNPHKSSSNPLPHSINNPQVAPNGNEGECWQRRSYTPGADAHWDKPRSDFDSGRPSHSKSLQAPNEVVFVRGLARDITDLDIRKDISDCRLWPKDVRIVMDGGVSRGLAFITFNSVDEATRWMEMRKGVLNLRHNNHAFMDYSNPTSRDWECVRCHTMNFRYRTACHICFRIKEDCLDGWEEASPYPTNAILLRGLSSSTSNAEVIKTLKGRLEGTSRLDAVQMGKDATGRARPLCFVQLTSVVDSIALYKSLSTEPLFVDGQHATVSYCQLDKLPPVMEPCGPHSTQHTHSRLPATLPPSLTAGLLNLPPGSPSSNIPLVTRTPVPSAMKGLGISTQAIRSMLEGNYTEKDIPILAQYCATAYAKTPQERVAYVNYYTKHYKDRLLKSVASKMMKLS